MKALSDPFRSLAGRSANDRRAAKTVIPLSVRCTDDPRTAMERRAAPGARGITCDGLSMRISTYPGCLAFQVHVVQKYFLQSSLNSVLWIRLTNVVRHSIATG